MRSRALSRSWWHLVGFRRHWARGFNIPELIGRAADSEVQEVILALSATVDGQTTAHYIAEKLGEVGISVSGLAWYTRRRRTGLS